MKKWLKVVLVLFLIGAVAAVVAGYQLNTRFGWLASSPVFHDTMATGDTRIRVAADTLKLGAEMAAYFPEDVALPGWLPWDLPAMLPRVLPREVALLGGSNFRSGTFDITLFINEQRGGPALPTYLNTRTQFKRSFPAVTWDEPGFTLEGRGKLSAKGHLSLPPDLEATMRETWPAEPPAEPLTLAGGHLAEAVVDNRNGEIVALIGALAPVWNTSLEQLQQDPQVIAVLALLADVNDLRVAVDFENPDTLVVQVRIQANAAAGKQLEFMLPMAMPMLIQRVQRAYGLTIQPETAWDPNEEIFKIDVTLTGIEEKLKAYFQRVMPRRPAPVAPKEPAT